MPAETFPYSLWLVRLHSNAFRFVRWEFKSCDLGANFIFKRFQNYEHWWTLTIRVANDLERSFAFIRVSSWTITNDLEWLWTFVNVHEWTEGSRRFMWTLMNLHVVKFWMTQIVSEKSCQGPFPRDCINYYRFTRVLLET